MIPIRAERAAVRPCGCHLDVIVFGHRYCPKSPPPSTQGVPIAAECSPWWTTPAALADDDQGNAIFQPATIRPSNHRRHQ